MKDRYKNEDKKIQHINSKSWNPLMQPDLIMNWSFIYQKNIFLLFYSESEENKYPSSFPFSEIFFSLS